MSFILTYHPHVVRTDIPKLSTEMQRRIKNAIKNKLSVEPESFTKPLRHSLQECRVLRVGDYRIVIQVQKKIVRVIAIVHRSKEYKNIEERL